MTHMTKARTSILASGCLFLALSVGTLLSAACGGPESAAASALPAPSAPPAPAAPPAAATPVLTFEPVTLDMGDVVPNVAITKTVKITNHSKNTIKITRAIADCSCTVPSWPEEPIAPGATAETTITMTPGNKQGVSLTKKVTFDVEGGEPAFYTVVAKVGMFIEFTPESLTAPEDDKLPGADATVSMKGADGVQFKIIAIEPDIGTADSAGSALTHTVKLDWAKWAAAKKPKKVTITTDHPKAPPLIVMLKKPAPAPASPTPASPTPAAPPVK